MEILFYYIKLYLISTITYFVIIIPGDLIILPRRKWHFSIGYFFAREVSPKKKLRKFILNTGVVFIFFVFGEAIAGKSIVSTIWP